MTVILSLNQIYNTNDLFHEEFVSLDAIINILLSKQYISILKNHCLANSSAGIQQQNAVKSKNVYYTLNILHV